MMAKPFVVYGEYSYYDDSLRMWDDEDDSVVTKAIDNPATSGGEFVAKNSIDVRMPALIAETAKYLGYYNTNSVSTTEDTLIVYTSNPNTPGLVITITDIDEL